MNDEKKYSEREKLAFQRAAWAHGMRRSYELAFGGPPWPGDVSLEEAAKKEFPAPKIERPRVVIERGAESMGSPIGLREWRLVDGILEHRDSETDWKWTPADEWTWGLDRETIAMLHDLYTNPTETVEAE